MCNELFIYYRILYNFLPDDHIKPGYHENEIIRFLYLINNSIMPLL